MYAKIWRKKYVQNVKWHLSVFFNLRKCLKCFLGWSQLSGALGKMLSFQTEMGAEDEGGHGSPRTSHGMGMNGIESRTTRMEVQLVVLYSNPRLLFLSYSTFCSLPLFPLLHLLGLLLHSLSHTAPPLTAQLHFLWSFVIRRERD